VSELFVNVGDIIKPGQKLLVLSAMKMENEILAEYEGKIKEIKIAKNQKVKEGEVLITLV
jgi:glutaconyl-CoA/methylmalonyl-CoA decarboxylase subunit gamma